MHQTAIMDCSYMKHFAPPIFTNINKYRLHNFLILNASHLMCPVCLIHIHQSHQSFVHWSISQDTAATNFCSVTNGLICAWVGSIVTLLHKITSKLCLMCCLWTCQIESHAVSSSAALVSWYKMLPGRLRQHMFQISEQGSPQTSTNCQNTQLETINLIMHPKSGEQEQEPSFKPPARSCFECVLHYSILW